MFTKTNIIKSMVALAGILLVGVGIAFNASAKLGNDSIGIFYDGVRNTLNLTGAQLGMASNIVNASLVVLLLFIGRHYINVGTFIYILPYGFFVDLGVKLYKVFFPVQFIQFRILAVVIGCLFIWIGVALYIAMDIGVDPFTGVTLVIGDKIGWEYGRTKVLFDITMIIIGTLLGGKIGAVTIVAALAGGPSIHFMSKKFTKIIDKIEQSSDNGPIKKQQKQSRIN